MSINVVYQGFPGAFGNMAALNYIKKNYGDNQDFNISFLPRFEDVVDSTLANDKQIGILPLENSNTGGITEVLNILLKSDLYMVGEETVKVVHNLLAYPGSSMEDIKTVMSHPQAISQSSEFLSVYKDWQLIPKLNTAESAKLVMDSQDKSLAAIASTLAKDIYGLEILKEAINNSSNNFTRFAVVSNKPYIGADINKYSIIFSVSNRCGSLLEVLEILRDNKLNLTKIESRPYPDKIFEYIFFADIEGDFNNTDMNKVFGQMAYKTRLLKILGGYRVF